MGRPRWGAGSPGPLLVLALASVAQAQQIATCADDYDGANSAAATGNPFTQDFCVQSTYGGGQGYELMSSLPTAPCGESCTTSIGSPTAAETQACLDISITGTDYTGGVGTDRRVSCEGTAAACTYQAPAGTCQASHCCDDIPAPSVCVDTGRAVDHAHCEWAAPISRYVCAHATRDAKFARGYPLVNVSNATVVNGTLMNLTALVHPTVYLLCTLGETSGCDGADFGDPSCQLQPDQRRERMTPSATAVSDPFLSQDVQTALGLTELQIAQQHGMSSEEFGRHSASARWRTLIQSQQCLTTCQGLRDEFWSDCLDGVGVSLMTDHEGELCDHRACKSSLDAIRQAFDACSD